LGKDFDKITYRRLPWQQHAHRGCSSPYPKILDGILNDECAQDGVSFLDFFLTNVYIF
jgi:hypothetical protein